MTLTALVVVVVGGIAIIYLIAIFFNSQSKYTGHESDREEIFE